MTLSFSITDVICNGGSDGSITVHVTGGIPPFTYTWSTLDVFTTTDTFSILSGLPASTLYWVQVTDSDSPQNGAYSGFLTITEPPPLVIDAQSSTNISCNGANDGTISISVSGGTPSYEYSIDGGSTFVANGGNFSGLAGGNYPVIVRDSEGCTVSGSTETITDPPGISFLSQNKTDITCNGLTDGTIAIVVSGGVAPYTYSINGGITYQNNGGNYTGLGAGNYDIAVKDINGCSAFGATLTVTEPSLLVINSQGKTDVTCNGGNDGTITITASGGVPAYQYSIDGGASWFSNGGLFTGLTSGNYDVAVQDINGCITNGTTLVISQPPALGFDTQTSTDVSCNGGSDGTLTISVSGGTAPYQYSNDGGINFTANGGNFSGLPAGNYDIAVKDANSCIFFGATLTVSEPLSLVINTQTKTDITCFGANDGTINVSVSGGTSPYEYSIDGGTTFIANGGSFTNLSPGIYDIAVRDNNLCLIAGVTLTISEPSEISITSEVATDISCNGASDGKIVITAAGGTPAYTYSIDAGITYAASGSFTGLPPGNYDVMVMDQNGCTKAGSTLVVNEPPALTVVSENVIDNLCFGETNGSVSISVSGGISPFTYSNDGGTSWLNNGGNFTGLAAGSYAMAARDQNGCIVNGSILNVGEPPELIIDSTKITEITCSGYADGSLQIYVHGGTPNYRYSIDGGVTFFSNGGIFIGLAAGNYDVAVQDANGCIKAGNTMTITNPPAINIDSEVATDITCNGLSDGRIQLSASGGTAPYRYSVDNGLNFSGNGNITGLSTGSYQVVVQDSKGCLQNGSTLSINEPAVLQVDSEQGTDVLCNGGTDGHIEITASGGVSPYSYSVDGGLTFLDNGGVFTGLGTGNYSVALKDQNGCLKTGSTLTLSEPTPLTMTFDTTKASCNKFTADGSIQITPGGGTPGYTFSIDGGINWQTNALFNNLVAGSYAVVLRDTNLCILNNSLVLESRFTVVADAGKDTSICPGGQVTLQGAGGTTYQWSPAGSLNDPDIPDPVASPTTTTQYALTITEGTCSDVDSVTVTVFDLPQINAGKDTSIFRGTSIQLTATGGVFAAYSWSPGTGLSGTSGVSVMATPSEDMMYRVIGTSTDGCLSSDSIIITIIREIVIPSGFTPNNDGYNDTWVIDNAWLFPDIVVEVVNRWGQRVFYSRGYGSGQEWDGTRNGKELPIGTYYYVIIINDSRGSRPVTGPITIIR